MSDYGVTLLMPHIISRDLMKRLTDHADKIGLIAKDKRNIIIHPDHLEILHFDIANPMPQFILDILYKKEAFIVCWKNGDTELRPIEGYLIFFLN